MADTQRTKSALATLFADNSNGDISAQDLRDFLESAHFSFGSFYISSSAATTPAGAGTYLKALGTTTSVSLHRFTMPANNRLTYTGTPDVHAHIAVSVSMTTAANNKVIGIGVAKNGTMLEHSKLQRKVSTAGDIGSTALHADASLSTNDYLEIWIANITDTTDVTLDLGYCFAMGMLV